MAKNDHSKRHQYTVRCGMMLFDALVVNGSYLLALILRFFVRFRFNSGAEPYFWMILKAVLPFTPVLLLVFYGFRLYQVLWEYAGVADLKRIFCATLTTGILYVPVTMVFFGKLPLTVYLLGPIIQFIALTVSRFGYKLYLLERNQRITRRSVEGNALIIGIGPVGQFAAKQVDQSGAWRTACYADLTGNTGDRTLNGVPVVGSLEEIDTAISRRHIRQVIAADPTLLAEDKQKLEVICAKHGIQVRDYIAFLQHTDEDNVSAVSIPSKTDARIIPFSPPDISDAEIEEVRLALKSGWITTGPRTKELERRLAAFCHTSRVVCLNSATAAEELNLRICGIGPGDEVIVPAYTYTATASAVLHCGATVVFVDSQKGNCEMDYDAVAAAITPRTKAVVAVDLGGIIADYDRLLAAVESKRSLFSPMAGDSLGARIQQRIGRVLIFADGAHSLGATRYGKMAGEIADFTSFSFHAVKNFTTAEGGASTWLDIPGVDNDEIYRQFQLYSLHGQSKDALAKTKLGAWEYDIVGPWYKCNMTDIMAAIGLRQLDRYPGLLQRRREIIGRYDASCDALGVQHLTHYAADAAGSGHLYLARIPGITDAQRREIITRLAECGVATNVHYKPLPMMTAYKAFGWDIKDFPNAYAYYENLISLPLHTKLTDEDVAYVCEKFTEVVKEYLA